MSSNVLWTILVATLGQRTNRFLRLLDNVMPQTDEHGGKVTVLAFRNNGERPLSHVRQALVEHASSSYVSFVDDDDVLPEYHVREVVACLDGEPDYVGWRMQCIMNGISLKPTFHSLRHGRWHEDASGYYRDISHLNPVRRELALKADFRRGDPPEDVSWVNQMRGFVSTECYVDKIMYYYHASSSDSTWRPGSVRSHAHPLPDIIRSNFSYHSEST